MATLSLFSCRPHLSEATIRQHPALDLEVLQPRVVDASAAFPPMWTRSLQEGDVSVVRFTGQSSGASLEEAKVQAERDALAAASNFIAVDVTSDFRSEESSGRLKEGVVDESEVTSVVRTHSDAQLRGVRMEAAYWEKVVDSPLTAQNATYRYFVRALIPKSEIMRARLQKQLSRREETGQSSIVILPFRASLVESKEDAALGVALTEELSRRLSARAGIHVSDPALVRAILPPDAELSEAERLDLVHETLLPDFVVAGSYQVRGGKIRATLSLYLHQKPEKVLTFERAYHEVFALEDDLLSALSKAIDLAPSTTAAGPRSDTKSALLEYAAAYERMDDGDLRGALAKLEAAWTVQPEDPRITLLMGRVLERMGRFGRIPSRRRNDATTKRDRDRNRDRDRDGSGEGAGVGDVGTDVGMPRICTDWSLISEDTQEVFMRAEVGDGLTAREIEDWERRSVNVDHVLSGLLFVYEGGDAPNVPRPERPLSAAGAYYRAFELARAANDLVLAEEAEEALGALAIRTDRLEAAESIFRTLLARGEARKDRHLMSLALYGYGKARLGAGDVKSALHALEAAFVHRAVLGEKPYLMEIMNELGNALIQLGRYDEATDYLERARRIADELGIRYLSAVLDNNLGIIDLLLGRTARADERFSRAFEVLDQQEDAEGRMSAALNIQQLGLNKGDIERARAYLALVRRVLKTTTPLHQVASYYEHQGSLSSAVGLHRDALRDLLRSFVLFRRAGRGRDALRLRSNLVVADFRQHVDAHRRQSTSWDRKGDAAPAADAEAASRMQCSKDVAEDLLVRAFGDDLSVPVLAGDRDANRDSGRRRSRSHDRGRDPDREHGRDSGAGGDDDGQEASSIDRLRLVARLNAEALRGLVDVSHRGVAQ
ncbi:MAG: tetratricopeptide repeat protein [Deltaproteobacteria bacterium]|nr:tetratricopeptide repeat protein [Deltaproteobacteria bacterium]